MTTKQQVTAIVKTYWPIVSAAFALSAIYYGLSGRISILEASAAVVSGDHDKVEQIGPVLKDLQTSESRIESKVDEINQYLRRSK